MVKGRDYDKVREQYETKDTKRNRQARRRQRLDELAQAAGWASYSEYETALKNGEVGFPRKPNPVDSEIIHKSI